MKKLEIDNIELNYGTKNVLQGIYFKAEAGKITGILGSNGCGKTSLLRILFGELKPKSKLIRIDSKPILRPMYSKGIVKYLPQFHYIPKSLTLKNIFHFNDVDYTAFADLFPDFKDKRHFKFKQLSGGEKRLIEVYTTIKSPSKILLLDEPFSYLAPVYTETLKDEILRSKEDKFIIITDHHYKKILDISDQLYLIKDGWSKLITSNEQLVQYNYLYSL